MSRAWFITWALFLVLLPREPWTGAARLHTVSAHEWVARGAPDLAGEGAIAGTWIHAGRRWAVAPLGPTLGLVPLEVPLLLLPKTDNGARAAQLVEAAATAAAAALICALLFSLTGFAGAAVLATTIVVYARIPDGSVLAGLVLLSGVLAARRFVRESSTSAARRWSLLLGLAAGALALFDLAAPAVLLLIWALIFAEARRGLVWTLPPFLVGVALAVAHRIAISAPPVPGGDLLEGLDGLLLSTGKSVFLYSPPLILAVPGLRQWWRNRRPDVLLVGAIAVLVILSAAALERWDGDPAWGPRRLVPLVPLLAWPACDWLRGHWRRRRLLLSLLLGAGISVQILGMAFPADSWLRLASAVKTSTGAGGWFAHGDEVHFMPQFSPLAGHAWMLKNVLKKNPKPEPPPWTLLQPAVARYENEYKRLRLDWWALSLSRDTVTK